MRPYQSKIIIGRVIPSGQRFQWRNWTQIGRFIYLHILVGRKILVNSYLLSRRLQVSLFHNENKKRLIFRNKYTCHTILWYKYTCTPPNTFGINQKIAYNPISFQKLRWLIISAVIFCNSAFNWFRDWKRLIKRSK